MVAPRFSFKQMLLPGNITARKLFWNLPGLIGGRKVEMGQYDSRLEIRVKTQKI